MPGHYINKPIGKMDTMNELIIFYALKKMGIKHYRGIEIETKTKPGFYYPDFFIDRLDYKNLKYKGIIIEADSPLHSPKKDEIRDEILEKLGYKVIRLKDNEIKSVKNVIEILTPIFKDLGILK
jgi:very-short-patch-repair endonuclease